MSAPHQLGVSQRLRALLSGAVPKAQHSAQPATRPAPAKRHPWPFMVQPKEAQQ